MENTRAIYGIFNRLLKLESSEYIKETLLQILDSSPKTLFQISDPNKIEENIYLYNVLVEMIETKEVPLIRNKLSSIIPIDSILTFIDDKITEANTALIESEKHHSFRNSSNQRISPFDMKLKDSKKLSDHIETGINLLVKVYTTLYFDPLYSQDLVTNKMLEQFHDKVLIK